MIGVYFGLTCALTGLIVGLLRAPTPVIAVTSVQILAFVFGVWLIGHADWLMLWFWAVLGLFVHQGAFLAVLLSRRDFWPPSDPQRYECELRDLERLARSMRDKAPELRYEAAEMTSIVARIRRVLSADGAPRKGSRRDAA